MLQLNFFSGTGRGKVFLALLFQVTCFLGCAEDPEYQQLEETHKKQTLALDQAVATVKTLEEDVARLREDIKGYQKDIRQHKATIESLTTEKQALASRVKTLKAAVQNLADDSAKPAWITKPPTDPIPWRGRDLRTQENPFRIVPDVWIIVDTALVHRVKFSGGRVFAVYHNSLEQRVKPDIEITILTADGERLQTCEDKWALDALGPGEDYTQDWTLSSKMLWNALVWRERITNAVKQDKEAFGQLRDPIPAFFIVEDTADRN